MAIDLKTVGGRIRACRLETGMSQERLAELSDLSPPYVSHVERGAKGPSLGALIRLSAALGVTIDYLPAGCRPTRPPSWLTPRRSLLIAP